MVASRRSKGGHASFTILHVTCPPQASEDAEDAEGVDTGDALAEDFRRQSET